MRRVSHKPRPAFTLVELMMVVTIIGILVGLIVPAVFYGMKQVKSSALSMNVQNIAQAIEQYKNKVGEYPPDGSNTEHFQRHFRKRFPNILQSEFTNLYGVANSFQSAAGNTLAVMDAPEAIVFALGGFSASPTQPFTGQGGPLVQVGNTYKYNVDRNEPLFDFDQALLTLDDTGTSTDEALYGSGTNDALPCYHSSRLNAPIVYFSSVTYSFTVGGTTFFNYYGPGGGATLGVARPYRSDKVDSSIATVTLANADRYYRYQEPKGFQLIGAGLDDNFGNVMPPSGSAGPRFYAFPSGESIDFSSLNSGVPSKGVYSQFLDDKPDVNKFQQDNVANFAEGPFANALRN